MWGLGLKPIPAHYASGEAGAGALRQRVDRKMCSGEILRFRPRPEGVEETDGRSDVDVRRFEADADDELREAHDLWEAGERPGASTAPGRG